MDEKNLPIRFFSMREKDERMTEGAGDSEIPNWVDREAIPQKKQSFALTMAGVSTRLSEKIQRSNYLPSVISLHLNQNALAKGHRENIASIFNDRGEINIIGVLGNDRVMVKVNTPNEANRIERKILNFHVGDKTYLGVAAIDEIEDFVPTVEDDIDTNNIIKIKLINYYDRELNGLFAKSFERSCEKKGIQCSRCKYSNNSMIVYRGQGITTDQLSFVYIDKRFGWIKMDMLHFLFFSSTKIPFVTRH